MRPVLMRSCCCSGGLEEGDFAIEEEEEFARDLRSSNLNHMKWKSEVGEGGKMSQGGSNLRNRVSSHH